MNHIVITGGSRGIGQALAHEFLHQGCRVSLTSRNRETVEATVAELVASTGNKACQGFGSDGRIMEPMSTYETISPGMVVTDMLLEPLRPEPEKISKALKVFHILADPPDAAIFFQYV